MTMNWTKLLNPNRRKPKDEAAKASRVRSKLDDQRTAFERDYDRVIFTSSFRRLQDKAQVFPLEASDFVRTRLTHSIEVSTIGRSLAVDVGRKLQALHKEAPRAEDIATVVATSCLLHDIGNPPFGHFGEKAIQEWFQRWFNRGENLEFIKHLKCEQKNDFLHFEGNAQALRIVTRLQALSHDYGINLSFATLGSLIKYPCSSSVFDPDSENKALHKPGYFQSEKGVFEQVVKETGTGNVRHPLVYLMEAADDIAYSVIDIEDAVKKGVLSFQEALDFLKRELNDKTPDVHTDLFADLDDFMKELEAKDWPELNNAYMQQLRILAHSVMIQACSEAFVANYEAIMKGGFYSELVKVSDARHLVKAFKGLAAKKVYIANSVLTLEYLGKEVIHGLLDRFVPAVLSPERKDHRTSAGKLYNLISPTFRDIETRASSKTAVYNNLQLVTDFICGMTDSYALGLYQRLTGVKI